MPAAPTVTWANPAGIVSGAPLSRAPLDATANVLGTFTPSVTAYQGYATAVFTVAAGPHIITFRGLDSAGGDNTTFIDAVSVRLA
jgi:hypothetical protein